jgi:hypothetical protein
MTMYRDRARELREEQDAAAKRGDWDGVLGALNKESKRAMTPGELSNRTLHRIDRQIQERAAPHREERQAIRPEPVFRSGGKTPRKGRPPAGQDVAAVRALLAQLAEAAGLSLDELAGPFRPGHQTEAEQSRRGQAAQIVAAAHEQGATQATIGDVLGLRKQVISDLVREGGAGLSPNRT